MKNKQLLNELTQKLAQGEIIFQINDLIYWAWKVKVENGTETKTGREVKKKIGNLSLTPEYYRKKWMKELKESLKKSQPPTQTSASVFMNIPKKNKKTQRINQQNHA